MRFLAFLLIVVCAIACKRGPELPIGDEKLVKVLADAHVAEAAVQNLSGLYKDSVKREYYNQIYEMHRISESDLRLALDILSNHPDKMEKLYRNVEKRLMEQEEKAGAAPAEQK